MNLLLKARQITVMFSILLFTAILSSILLFAIFANSTVNKTSLNNFYDLIRESPTHTGGDSWDTMVFALDTYNSTKDSSTIYSSVFFDKKTKFQYPPSSLLIYIVPNKIFNISYAQITEYFKILSLISLFVIALLSIKVYSFALKKLDLSFTSKIELYFNYILIFLLCFLFYPLTKSYHLGQIQTILTLSMTLSLFFHIQNKYTYSGIFLGLVCLVKPHFVIILVWSLFRKKWSFLISSIITITFFGIISLFYFGFNNHLDYLNTLSFLSKHGESYFPNQSVNGLFNRLLFNGNNLEWSYASFPPFSTFVYTVTLVSSLIFLCFALYKKHKDPILDIIDFSIILLSITISSPIAWEHHYSIIFPIFIGIIIPYCSKVFENKFKYNTLFFIFLVVIYSFASQNFSILNHFSGSRFNFLQSYLFFSALFILIVLYKILFKVKNTSSESIKLL